MFPITCRMFKGKISRDQKWITDSICAFCKMFDVLLKIVSIFYSSFFRIVFLHHRLIAFLHKFSHTFVLTSLFLYNVVKNFVFYKLYVNVDIQNGLNMISLTQCFIVAIVSDIFGLCLFILPVVLGNMCRNKISLKNNV